MTRSRVRPEEPRELSEREAFDTSSEERPREEDRVDHGRGDARTGEPLGLTIEEGEVEARVVGDEDRVPREVEEALHRFGRPRRALQMLGAHARDRRCAWRDPEPGVDERLELVDLLELADPDGPDLADRGGSRTESRRLEVDDDIRRLLEEKLGSRRLR